MLRKIVSMTVLTFSVTAEATDYGSWLSEIEDDVYICQLSIPGTHDSGTGQGFSGIWAIAGPSTAKTQSLTITRQLEAGVRVLDLRPAVDGEKLSIFHGVAQTKIAMAGTMSVCLKFLEANPSEFVMFITRHETDGDDGNTNWPSMMADFMEGHTDRIVEFRPDLTVGEARGRVIVVTRDSYPFGKAGVISGWGDNATWRSAYISCGGRRATLWLQDNYDCTGDGGLEKKTDAITDMLIRSSSLHESRNNIGTWVINHTSGYTKAASTSNNESTAASTAKALITAITSKGRKSGSTGIVMMDFAGGKSSYDGRSLVEAVVDNNSQYVPLAKEIATGVVSASDNRYGKPVVYTISGTRVYGELLAPGVYIIVRSDGRREKRMIY